MVGLTGGIGAGKSAVSRRLAARGAIVIDADLLARQVVEPGTDGLAEVIATFGTGVLAPDGTLDRPALGRLVFGDPDARRRLEAIIHPRVRARAAEIISVAPADAVIVNDIPLLVESGLAAGFGYVIVVETPEHARIARLISDRGMSEGEARSRIAAQATDEERRAVADVVIVNDGAIEELDAHVDALWPTLLALPDHTG